MIAVNRPPNNIPENQKSKIMSLTRRDVDPISTTPIFVNEKFSPSSIECSPSDDGNYQSCAITNLYGQKSTLNNIGFINQQVSKSTVNVYRHPNGEIKTRMDFAEAPICEVFGVYPSLTLKCSDAPQKQNYPPSPYN